MPQSIPPKSGTWSPRRLTRLPQSSRKSVGMFGIWWTIGVALVSLGAGCADPEGSIPEIAMVVPEPAALVSPTPWIGPSPTLTLTPTTAPPVTATPTLVTPTPVPNPSATPIEPTPSPASTTPPGPSPTPSSTPSPTPTPTVPPTPTVAPDADQDGFPPASDCDDSDPQTNPGASELCDGVDNNCDGSASEEADGDLDGVRPCDVPPDCNDADASVYPGAIDFCDGVDQDCDGTIDEDNLPLWYADADGDGWGSLTVTTAACQAPEGYTNITGDCDDASTQTYPLAPELCDQKDNSCDGQIDEALDLDQDGFTPCASPADCNDQDPTIYPGQLETCDGVDQNCDGDADSAWKTPEGLGMTVTANAPASGADGTPGHPFPTIQQGIDASSDACTVVWINPGTYPENLRVLEGAPQLYGAFGSSNTVVNGGGKGSVLTLEALPGQLRVQGLTLENGKAARGGGIFCSKADLAIEEVTLADNSAQEFGGGIYAEACTLSGLDAVLEDNIARASAGTAGGAGAGIYAQGGSSSLENVSIRGGSTYQFGGGAAFLDGHEAYLNALVVEDNQAGTYAFAQGGGIYVAYSHVQLQDSSVLNNSAQNQGGGLWISACQPSAAGEPCRVEQSWFEGNRTLAGGGAGVAISGSSKLSIVRSVFTENVATGAGGGLALLQSSPRVINSIFQCNTSGANGGGMYLDSSGAELIHNTLYENIVTQNGGGIYFTDASSSGPAVHIVNNVVYRNARNGIAHTGSTTAWVFLNNDVYSNGVTGQNWVGVADPTGTNGNLSLEPSFQVYKQDCELSTDTLEPMNTSPLLDAASEQGIAQDYRGLPRPVDANRDGKVLPDIGAYERQ